MTAVTIPPELAADVEARPEAYRPNPIPGVDVLVLAHDGDTQHPRVGTDDIPGAPYVDEDVTAWALVGSVDGGPRPEVGQRVLSLDGGDPGLWDVLNVADANTAGLWCDVDGVGPRYVTRWAVLPARCWVCGEPDHGTCPECDEALCQWHDGECSQPVNLPLLPNPAPDAPSAPPPATATPDPARGER
jgi:hypothetical protein